MKVTIDEARVGKQPILKICMAEKNASAAQTAQKFPIERLAKACRTLFHVSASTFAGATAGMTGEYTVEEMRKHIDEWLGKEAVV